MFDTAKYTTGFGVNVNTAYKVDDIHRMYQTLKDRDVHFIDDPHKVADMGTYELWMAFFRDSEGNTLAIMGEIPLS